MHSAPLRFLQIHSFYEQYLTEFYSQRWALVEESFQTQTNALLDQGFSAAHLFPPYLQAHGIEAQLIIANNPFSQAQWLREHNLSLSSQNWIYEIAKLQVEHLRPDILYLSHPIQFDRRFIDLLSWRPKFIMGWRAAAIEPTTNWSGFDLMLSHLSSCRELAISRGAKHSEHFFPGFPKRIAELVAGETKQFDLVFSGQWSAEHSTRNEMFLALARHNFERPANKQFSLRFFVPHSDALPMEVKQLNSGARWALDMHRTLRRAKIVLNGEINLAGGEAGNMRLFETTGTGSFLLTQHHDNIAQYFTPGREIETFRNVQELIEKVDYYLRHEEERETIARNGQLRCLSEYSMERRASVMLELLKKYGVTNAC